MRNPRYTSGTEISTVVDGATRTLTSEMAAADVVEQAGGLAAITAWPAGGATGQQLVKTGPTDGDVGWQPSGKTSVATQVTAPTGTMTRPPGAAIVIWNGPARPLNGQLGDVWIEF